MFQEKIYLASDNWAPAHPLVLAAVVEANEGEAPPYGEDRWTAAAKQVIQQAFESNCKVFIVPTGTGANVLALKIACRRHESVICTDIAHIQYQEAGAAESLVGCKLLAVPHREGKLTPEAVLKKLKSERMFGKHSTSPRVLSVAQSTELGTVYTLEELRVLAKLCREERLLFHIDGSRLYNAAVSLGCSLRELVEASQVDILSLGGTKNGLMGAESLLIFNANLEEGSDYQQKQTLQLPSKMRYLSTQFLPFFKDDLWQTLAKHANQKAQEIAAMIREIPQFTLCYPVDTNQVFFTLPASWIPLLQQKVFCHLWDAETNEVRLIASWKTSEKDVNDLKVVLSDLALHH